MGLEGCGKCMKYSMFAANLLITIGAITIIAIGIWSLADKTDLEQFMGTDMLKSSASILISMGVIVLLIAALGCLGAIKENKCMLLSYCIILLIIFILILVGGILSYVYKEKVEENVRKEMNLSVKNYGKTDTKGKAVTEAWDSTQKYFKCCGVVEDSDSNETYGYKIWKMNPDLGMGLPQSCCKESNDCGNKTTMPTPGKFYLGGCVEAVSNYLKDHSKILGGVGIGIACLMILGIVFSFALYRMLSS